MKWPWLRHSHDCDEAKAALERAQSLEAEVQSIGKALADLEMANHFSRMVYAAIAHAGHGTR